MTHAARFINMDQLKSQHGLVVVTTSILNWGIKLFINFQTPTVQPLKFGNG